MPNKEIIFRRRLSRNNLGAFRLSIPPQLADYLGATNGSEIALIAVPGKPELLIKLSSGEAKQESP